MTRESRGRPKFEVTKKVIAKVEDLAAQGLTKKEIAYCLGICYDTLNERVKENSDFSEAIERGQAKGIQEVTNALMKQCRSGDMSAVRYYLNNRSANWNEKRDLTVNDNRAHGSISEISQEIREMLGDNEAGPSESVITH